MRPGSVVDFASGEQIVTPDDVAWACLVAERDLDEPFVPIPDTPTARALAAELLALPTPVLLERLRATAEKYERILDARERGS